jgi:protein TonB
MNVAPEGRKELARWIICAVLVLSAHVGMAAATMQWSDPEDDGEVGGAIVIELAPIPVARMDTTPDMLPGPDQVEAELTPEVPPVEKIEEKLEDKIEQALDPEVTLAIQEPDPTPTPPTPTEVMPAPVTSALLGPQVPELAAVPVAPMQAMPNLVISTSLPKWKNEVADLLERNKRYPQDARNRHQQGTVQLAFSIDREGRVLASRVATSSGSSALDKEALELAVRASPFPRPPADLRGDQINLTVPIRFNIK